MISITISSKSIQVLFAAVISMINKKTTVCPGHPVY